MDIVDRVSEIEREMQTLIDEARHLKEMFRMGYRNTEDVTPDNVVSMADWKKSKGDVEA